ncbi:ATP-dependent DNA helicase RecG [Marinihelvus fidelis]|uniref:ATP-dependent DNA helicase RecG n=1 Tax=Marinihelvus fidelis TaxID=2613842 RepID=A0A5N0T8M7_9GAMM|nr:ATP-dependent DNA helicase RecG [Marinihelvus fidelis]KAA9131282.1 ATP-dependent DNA helicase RecG [Marinihelvus fidelis]
MPEADDLTALAGVGPKMAERLANLGLHQVRDLLFHLPLRYEDRTRLRAIGELLPGAPAQVEGRVDHAAIVRGRRSMLVVSISDGTGRLTLRFFHFTARQKQQFATGATVRCYGEARGGFQGLEMVHPTYSLLREGQSKPLADRLTSIYPSTEGIGQSTWTRLTDQALAQLAEGKLALQELLPENAMTGQRPMSLESALNYIHRPPPDADVAALVERRHPAQQRLAIEELLAHHLAMRLLNRRKRAHDAPRLDQDGELERQFLAALPFEPTRAQARVCEEIRADLAGRHPMLRLVHGDVGSGKTVVAALAALRAIVNGYQVAVMAPTELLAEQHLRVFGDWLRPLGIEPAWLSGKVTGKARASVLEAIAAGAPLVVGTHALMQDGVEYARLGLVIVDEQHRFGVHQRMALMRKGEAGALRPHQLIMTATPIPRTLAMTAYAGMEVSVIDELPPGRTPVTTAVLSAERRGEIIRRVAAACESGRQAYWVCTLIEESDAVQAQAAEAVALELRDALGGLRVGLVHGRKKAADKQARMLAFKAGEIDLLVATTVIEVGVDVPNATLMIIENAERLGLSQLHQLRGRVGRGAKQSSCVLIYDPPLGDLARQRLDIMRESTDGFRIAEKDLELRGPGDVLGTRQTGMLQFRVADLGRDAGLLNTVQEIADGLLDNHPHQVNGLVRRWVGDATEFAGV